MGHTAKFKATNKSLSLLKARQRDYRGFGFWCQARPLLRRLYDDPHCSALAIHRTQKPPRVLYALRSRRDRRLMQTVKGGRFDTLRWTFRRKDRIDGSAPFTVSRRSFSVRGRGPKAHEAITAEQWGSMTRPPILRSVASPVRAERVLTVPLKRNIIDGNYLMMLFYVSNDQDGRQENGI